MCVCVRNLHVMWPCRSPRHTSWELLALSLCTGRRVEWVAPSGLHSSSLQVVPEPLGGVFLPVRAAVGTGGQGARSRLRARRGDSHPSVHFHLPWPSIPGSGNQRGASQTGRAAVGLTEGLRVTSKFIAAEWRPQRDVS